MPAPRPKSKAGQRIKREKQEKQAVRQRVSTALSAVRDCPVPLEPPHRPPEITKSNRGRPTKLTPQVSEWVCNMIMHGYTALDVVRKGGPALPTLRRWRAESAEFRSLYEEALAMRTELHLEECIEIADRTPADHAAKARHQTDIRRYAMAHLLPHRFGKHVPGLGGGGGDDAGSSGLIAPIVQVFFGKEEDGPTPMRDITPLRLESPPEIDIEYGRETEAVGENVSEPLDKSSQEAQSQEQSADDDDIFVGGR